MASSTVSAAQVYQEVMSQGGSTTQAQVAAALVSGIESNGELDDQNPTSTASGLFQFLDTTWDNYGGVSAAKDASFQQQVAKFIQESGGAGGDNFYAWAPDLGGSYNGSGTYTTIGGKVAQVIDQNATSWGAAAPVANIAGAASSTGAGAATTTTAAAPVATTQFTIPGSTDPGFNPNSQTVQATGQEQTALDTLAGDLSAYGFNTQDANALTQWVWGEASQGVDPAQIAIDLQTPGTTGYTIFEKQFPGFVEANAQLNALGQPALNVQQYQQYQTTAEQSAQAAGLPPGFINSQNIGTFIGAGISTSELNQRINDSLTLAINSTPEQQAMFNQYFGTQYGSQNDSFFSNLGPEGTGGGAVNPSGTGPLTPGQIAAIALDPNAAEPLIRNQIAAAQLGGAGVTAGIGAISEAEAMQIAEAYGTTSGGTPGLSQGQIQSAVANVAPYSPLETARPGMGGSAQEGVVSPDQLIGTQLLPNAQNLRQLQTAQEIAKQAFSGGGGYTSSSKGSDVGSASATGAGQ